MGKVDVNMVNKYLGSCLAAVERFNITSGCCYSCHDDDDLGYDAMLEEEVEDGYYKICCEVSRAIDEKQNKEK